MNSSSIAPSFIALFLSFPPAVFAADPWPAEVCAKAQILTHLDRDFDNNNRDGTALVWFKELDPTPYLPPDDATQAQDRPPPE